MAITLLKLPEELHLQILQTCDSQSIGHTIISFGKKPIGNIIMKFVNILIEQRLLQNFHNYPVIHKDEKEIPDCNCGACEIDWGQDWDYMPRETPILPNKYEANQRFFSNKEELDQLAEDVDDADDGTLSQTQRVKRMIGSTYVHSMCVSQTPNNVETNTILSIQDMSLDTSSSESKSKDDRVKPPKQRVLILVSSSRLNMCSEGCSWCGGTWETVIDCVFPGDTQNTPLWAFCKSFGGYANADTNCNICTEDVAMKLLETCGLKNNKNDISFLIKTFTTMAPSKLAEGNQFELFDFKTRKRLDRLESHENVDWYEEELEDDFYYTRYGDSEGWTSPTSNLYRNVWDEEDRVARAESGYHGYKNKRPDILKFMIKDVDRSSLKSVVRDTLGWEAAYSYNDFAKGTKWHDAREEQYEEDQKMWAKK